MNEISPVYYFIVDIIVMFLMRLQFRRYFEFQNRFYFYMKATLVNFFISQKSSYVAAYWQSENSSHFGSRNAE